MQLNKSAKVTEEEGAVMNRLLDTVITYAMKRPASIASTFVNLNDVVTTIGDEIIYKNNNINCHISILNELPVIQGIPVSLMNQLFQNLIENAVKFNRSETPEVSISSAETASEYIFSVSDNGIGISPINYHSLFTIWGHASPKEFPGKKIGLVLCKTIVEHYGGKIWVTSMLDHGSIFYFSLDKSSLKNNGDISDHYFPTTNDQGMLRKLSA
jgi:light-regulated signal transduction histidine kinase (bacteriophytochrome)